ncbi:MAG TPA: MFS transporter [Gammaproteobacteria bacterium]|nr:MFS transporter [Gammaproteobacteria bacterium]
MIRRWNLSYLLPLGFASGLPLALTSGTLQAWLTVAGVDVKQIGLFALVGLPYMLKFLWAPWMDAYAPSWLDRRRGWMLICQVTLITGMAMMAGWAPAQGTLPVAALALFVAFASASQDVAYDAYRTDVLGARERGIGTALTTVGYRIAMLTSGALALILSEDIGWHNVYLLMAALMGIGMLATWCAPPVPPTRIPRHPLAQTLRDPFESLLSRPGIAWVLLFVVLYKLGDALAGALSTTFLLREMQYTTVEVGLINKAVGLAATLIGTLFAGALLTRWRLYPALMMFGVLQAVTILGFYALLIIGRSYWGLVAVVTMENLTSGMGTCAFTALLMALCDHRYSATQFALLTALASIGRIVMGSSAGYMVDGMGWGNYFLLSFILAWPALWVLRLLRPQILAMDAEVKST